MREAKHRITDRKKDREGVINEEDCLETVFRVRQTDSWETRTRNASDTVAAVWDWAQDKLLFPKNGKYIRSLNESETDTGLEGRAWDKEWYSWYLQVLSVQPHGGRPAHIPTWSLAVFFQSFSLSRSLFPAGWVLCRPATTVSENLQAQNVALWLCVWQVWMWQGK